MVRRPRRNLTAGKQLRGNPGRITIKELLSRFWVHAEQDYRTETDGRVKELEQFRLAFRPSKELYANTPAADFGPRARKALVPFLLRDADAYCFSPTEAVEEWRRQAFDRRATPLSQGNAPGTNRKDKPKWLPGEQLFSRVQ